MAVAGCVAQAEGEEIIRRAPVVDMVFGPQTLHRLPGLIRARRDSGRPQVDVSFPEIEKFDHLPAARKQGASAFVSIMEGCSKYCSFCVVPYTRGEEVSRPFDDVVREVAALCAQGVKEVTLLGQNVNAWRGTIDGHPADFAELLYFLNEIPDLERIRYTTSHPREFTQRLIDAHAAIAKLAPPVHLPVQSGSDRVLGAMKRQREPCIAYSKQRKQFGRPIGKNQSIANKIVDMALRLETGRLLLYKAASAKRARGKAALDVSMAKLYVSESWVKSCLDAVQIHGGYGYTTAYEVERDLRDSIGGTLYSGTSEIQRNIIATFLGL